MVIRPSHRAAARGITLLEVVFALGLLYVVASALLVAGSGHFAFIRGSLEEAVAERAAAARLESLLVDATALAPGETPFALDEEAATEMPGARGVEVVRAVEPRLLEVAVAVTWRPRGEPRDRRVALATLVAREERP